MNFYKTKIRSLILLPACAGFLASALALPAHGQTTGLVGGSTHESASGKPVEGAQIVAHNLNKGTDRATVTNADGLFAFTNLEPGPYEFAATKRGFERSAARIEVAATRPIRVDLPLQILADLQRPAVKADMSPVSDREKQMQERIDRLEARLAAMEARDATQPRTLVHAAPGPETASATPVAAPLPDPRPAPVEPSANAQPPAAPAPPPHAVPEAMEAPDAGPAVDNVTPFAYGDFTWLNGTTRSKTPVMDTKFFTPEIRFDTHFMVDFNQPRDHSMGGATESFRSGEFQVEQISVGGDFHWQNVRGRILTMDGLFATTTPRNDGSAGVGQWDVRGAYKYVSEAWGGYHWDVNHGLNVDAGIFVSYIGLFSYYNFDNWTYQPSFVSSNTPWFFNGLRIQWFPTNKLKIEPWIINGWQSYNKFNGHRGLGGQILWRPKEWFSLVSNNYGNGTDTLGVPGRSRLHTDDSIEVRYFNDPESTGLSKAAFSFTVDIGCEYGGGVTCRGGKDGPQQSFFGWMLYDRYWFHKDLFAITLGGGKMSNPGRYLTLLPPINGADAISGSPYFTANPGDKAHMWDATVTFQWMPKQYITWWLEAGYRHSDVPYWSGRGGITPPGGNNGAPGQYVCSNGASAGTNDLGAAYVSCGGPGSVWFPDLRKGQATVSAGVMVKF